MWYIRGIGLNSYKMKGLFESRGKVLVEASRGDRFWGIGLGMGDASKWEGFNAVEEGFMEGRRL